MSRRILVIDDDRDLADVIRINLNRLPADVDLAYDGIGGLAQGRSGVYDLIVLDLMLPGMDGLDVCRGLRAQSSYVPVLMLTSRATEIDRVLGLELGADDYLTKPFSVAELLARVKAILRRVDAPPPSEVRAIVPRLICRGPVTIDLDKRRTELAARNVELTPKEFDLLALLARYPGRVYSRTELLDLVWGYKHDGYEHTVNSHINRLRAKLEADPAAPAIIETVWGVGYRFNENLLKHS